MQTLGYTILGLGWIVWMIPFLIVRRKQGTAQQIDRRGRWGIIVVGISFGLVWQVRLWEAEITPFRMAMATLFLVCGCVLSWSATRALGRQWRIDAGLNTDHELVTAGPYRIVRHPIYTSMLCLLLGVGFMVARWWVLAIAVVVNIIGAEIRVRIEDGLLRSRFGEKFREFQDRVPAYIPFVR